MTGTLQLPQEGEETNTREKSQSEKGEESENINTTEESQSESSEESSTYSNTSEESQNESSEEENHDKSDEELEFYYDENDGDTEYHNRMKEAKEERRLERQEAKEEKEKRRKERQKMNEEKEERRKKRQEEKEERRNKHQEKKENQRRKSTGSSSRPQSQQQSHGKRKYCFEFPPAKIPKTSSISPSLLFLNSKKEVKDLGKMGMEDLYDLLRKICLSVPNRECEFKEVTLDGYNVTFNIVVNNNITDNSIIDNSITNNCTTNVSTGDQCSVNVTNTNANTNTNSTKPPKHLRGRNLRCFQNIYNTFSKFYEVTPNNKGNGVNWMKHIKTILGKCKPSSLCDAIRFYHPSLQNVNDLCKGTKQNRIIYYICRKA